MLLSCDFETTVNLEKVRVWAWGVCDIPFTFFKYGNDINSFFEHLFSYKENVKCYFHNLKFDGSFILNYLLSNSFEWSNNKKLNNKQFSTLISDVGQFYSIKIKQNSHIITILDSFKIVNLSVESIAKAFKLPIQKEEIDYKIERKINHKLSESELIYLRNDVEIVSFALNYFFEQNLTKMTQGSNALYEYKKIIGGEKKFRNFFPKLNKDVDKDIRKAYRGGFTFLNPKFKNKIIKEKGYVIDYNSLYPSVMYTKLLPFSQPIFFEGKYKYDKDYPLYIQHFRCQFKVKKGNLPTIQLKNNFSFKSNEYITDSGIEFPELYLTNIDLCLFFEHYEVYNLEFINGWKFRAQKHMFDEYIEKWSSVKIKAKNEGNSGLVIISKLMLNSLYGKFGSAPTGKSKIPKLEDEKLSFTLSEEEKRTPVYIPMAVFITSWARNETIRAAQKVYEMGKYIYSDTDSIHGLGDLPDFIPIDTAKLCFWKHEFEIRYCKYLRQKCYVDYGYEVGKDKFQRKITVAGLPKSSKVQFSLKTFNYGKFYKGKLVPKQVKGGVVLVEEEFTIKFDK